MGKRSGRARADDRARAPKSSEVRRRHRGKVSVDKMVGIANIAKALGGVHGPAAQVGSCSPYLDTQAGSSSRSLDCVTTLELMHTYIKCSII